MRKLTLAEAKETVARPLGLCASSSVVKDYINEAILSLRKRGKWVGTVVQLKVCTTGGILTWPREIETIESFAVCNYPGIVRNGWYEFNQNGPGILQDCDCAGTQLIDRGQSASYADIDGVNKKIRVYCDNAADDGAKVLIQGKDENGNVIYTTESGVTIYGENVAASVAGTLSVNRFTEFVVQKPITKGPIRLFEYDVDLAANSKGLSLYAPDETLPVYRRSLVPGLSDSPSCCNNLSTPCDNATQTTLTINAKIQFKLVEVDSDWIVPGDLRAIKLACMAIKREESNLFAESEALFNRALAELQFELDSYQGDGEVIPMRFQNADVYGGSVANFL